MGVIIPDWATDGLRPHQEAAVDQIADAYDSGAQVVVLDAPTGSGKTLIADIVRQMVGGKSLYVCSDRSLQAQFTRDFPESRVVMGRRNYTPNRIDHIGDLQLTCEDCSGPACGYCDSRVSCPYVVARLDATKADTAVLNTAYYLRELNGPGRFRRRKLTIFDECDTLEGYLMGWAEVYVSRSRLKQLRLTAPTKRSHWTTLLAWIRDALLPAMEAAMDLLDPEDPDERKEREGWGRLAGNVGQFVASYDAGEPWVKEVDGDVRLKPVLVSGFGRRGIWRHIDAGRGEKALLMSATVLAPKVMLDELGFRGRWESVKVPMTFPDENRPIYNLPVAFVTAKADEEALERLDQATAGVVLRHPGESVLVHSVSYKLTQRLVKAITKYTDRTVHTYLNSQARQQAVDDFSADPGSVLVAPSLERGVDLHGDLCRVMVIAKCPFPHLGDKQVSERLHTEGGQLWFDVQTIRALVQMTGRGVRSASDHATTYVLDDMFSTLVAKHAGIFPDWWLRTISTPFQPNDLIKSLTDNP